MQTIQDPETRSKKEGCLIDVRTPSEFEEVRISGAVNFPLGDLERSIEELREKSAGREVTLVCRTQNRSGMAKDILERAGFENLHILEGGVEGWVAAGNPVERGESHAISLERQVRMIAGALVVLGAALSLWVHPWFAGLSAFVGAGLIYAGATDTCGMAFLLAKMPWNRKRPAACQR